MSKLKQLLESIQSKNIQFYLMILTFLTGIFGFWFLIKGYTPESENITREPNLGTPVVTQAPKKEISVLLNDPSIKKNWGLMGTDGIADIRVNKAWNITQGSRDIVVAIIDTGADINHPDIKNNIWTNPGETGLDAWGKDKSSNGIDDDKDGFIDDVHGWNFVSNDGIVTDNHSHGTHVAGIIGAEGGNGIGISGVSPKVSMMIIKYYDPTSKGTDNLRNTIRSIDFAVQKGANIINYSGGGLDYSQLEFEAIRRAQQKGILFIAAAGNERSNSDTNHYYPANYPLDNIISVTAINQNAQVLSSSNYGSKTVHLAAPGENIYSTFPNGQYGQLTGTSQATAFVTGVAALIMANNRDFKYDMVRRQVLGTTDYTPSVSLKTQTSGILNSWAALAIQPSIPATGIISRPANVPIPDPTSVQTTTSDRTPSLARQITNINAILENLNKTKKNSL